MFGRRGNAKVADQDPQKSGHLETPEQTMARLKAAGSAVSESLHESLRRLEHSHVVYPPAGSPGKRATSVPATAQTHVDAPAPKPPSHPDELPDLAAEVWRAMLVGNHRWVTGKTMSNLRTPHARRTVSEHSKPAAVVISCVDARVPVEFIFDAGVGELVVVRTAGNVCDQLTLASAEFGLRRFKTPLIVVLAHSGCQAAELAVKSARMQQDEFSDGFASITSSLRPAYDLAVETARTPNYVPKPDEVAIAQAHRVADQLHRGHAVGSHVERGAVGVQVAIYDVRTGQVRELTRRR